MAGEPRDDADRDAGDSGSVASVAELARLLRQLRRREARRRGGPELTYRQLAARTGWAHGVIAEYFGGKRLAPTDRFDELVRLLGAGGDEQRELATARDRVADLRRARPAVGNRATDATRATGGAARQVPPTPMELPPDVYGFTGRADQLAELDQLLETSTTTSTMGIAVLAGTGGVGKTALAVRWAHRAGGRFPDGQLSVDLRGYDPGRPVSPEQALAALLRSLGVAGSELPPDLDQRAAQYRSLVAGRRMLVLLDNAYLVDQVRPLLPGTPSCFVVVTSRDDLAGLVAHDGARRVRLGPLPPADALHLLGTLIGQRVDAEPEPAAALADRCGRLPLALRIAAELVAVRRDDSLAELVAEFTGQRRLDLLDTGDDIRTGVRSTFSWSLRHLPAAVTATFRLLGLHPGQDFDGHAVAALAGADLDTTRRRIDRLERANLVQRGRARRYHLHDLLRAYAAELAAGDGDPRPATGRLLDHYLHTAAAAMDAVFPHDRDCRPRLPAPAGGPPVTAPQPALAWLDAERANLVAAGAHAARHGWPEHCTGLSRTIWRYLDVHGHYQDALALHTDALGAAPPGGQVEAGALSCLGMTHWRLGRCDLAIELLRRALAIDRAGGDRRGQATALSNLAIVYEQVGCYEESLTHHRQALAIHRELGDRRRQAGELGNLGALHCRLGEYPQAIECQQQAAAAGRELDDPFLVGYAMGNLGMVYQQLGRLPEALDSQLQALASSRAFGDRRGEAEMLRSLGVTYRRLRRFPEALGHLRQALALARELGHRGQEAETLVDLGETLSVRHQPEPALRHHRQAHAIATDVDDPHTRARALDGMADALDRIGRRAEAGDCWEAALTAYTDLGLPEADQVRTRLTELRGLTAGLSQPG